MNNQCMILSTATKANKTMTFRRGKKKNNIIKGTLENKNDHSNLSKHNDKQEEIRKIKSNVMYQKESKIEIELNDNQINNTNYNVQSYNDNKASSSSRINDGKDVDENKDNEPKQKMFGKSQGGIYCAQ